MMPPKPRVQWTMFMSQPAVTASSARQFCAGLNGAVVVFALLFVAFGIGWIARGVKARREQKAQDQRVRGINRTASGGRK